jgi:hypothetical protein
VTKETPQPSYEFYQPLWNLADVLYQQRLSPISIASTAKLLTKQLNL